MNKSEEAEGRVISLGFQIRLIPPQTGELGDTDAASAIGYGLIREAMLMLKNTGEREGFTVIVTATNIVY